MKKLLAALLALCLCLPALAEEIDLEKGVFVLMNIPYSMFYEEETTRGAYDSVSSATKQKSRSMDFSGGSFHMTPDGAYITGIVSLFRVLFLKNGTLPFDALKRNEGYIFRLKKEFLWQKN